jgi:hypothetical protein
MNPPKKLTTRQKTEAEEQALAQRQAQSREEREFGSVEEMLRHDALHTPVPPAISYRLQESISKTPRPVSSWWQRWFGGSR